VDKPFDVFFELDESTEIGNGNDFSFDDLSDGISVRDPFPRVRS
jgi:hypothetical protein